MGYNRYRLGRSPINRKLRQATALGYEIGVDEAPHLLAKGYERVAERIIEVANENNIPIRQDPVLTAALMTLDVDEMIPPQLYAVVAEVLAYVYRIQHKKMSL